MVNLGYIKMVISNFLKSSDKKVKVNYQLQQLYNSSDYYELLMQLQEYNLGQPMPFLASGMSCYFNDQIDEFGLSNLKLAEQDIDDARFIASCFGNEINYASNNLSILYTTLLGTSEFNYGMQTFPAGIFEDVFQCSPNHGFPIQPIVGENEVDFYCRILDYQISQNGNFPIEKRIEVLARAKRLASNFCNGKNRIYLIPFEDVLNNKASFGDVDGLRDGTVGGDKLRLKLESLPTFEKLLHSFNILINDSTMNPYNDPNMISEYGIAIYGQILSKQVSYFEVDRIYDLIQKRAQKLGCVVGEEIPIEVVLDPHSNQIRFSR